MKVSRIPNNPDICCTPYISWNRLAAMVMKRSTFPSLFNIPHKINLSEYLTGIIIKELLLYMSAEDCFRQCEALRSQNFTLGANRYIASFLDQGLFLEMWGGWMLSSDVAGVLQEEGDAYSRART